jgi:hypothetical protein
MKQTQFSRSISAFMFVSAAFFALPGCQKEAGPMEKAGQEIDQKVENFGQPQAGPAEKAGQAVDDAAEKTGQKIEQAGDKVQETAQGK